ncbi:MAG TPA: hypothetical protein VMR70_13075 [Flavisolibacter sp.]|nr:hypothetical protein [Flavisolibacter sp.]
MKRCVFACCFFISSLFAVAQTSFPKDFIGHWEGTLNWYKAGKKEPHQVKMQLVIQPADSANTYTWQIIYGEKGEDNRPYLLKPVDTAKGHWQVDERNGIIIDQYFIGNRLTSAFTVQTTTIVNSYWREGENLVAEFHGLTAKPVATTGLGTEESPKVESYGAKSYQRAVMKRR